MGFVILSLMSISSFALLANPGANCNGVADAAQGALTNSDYNNLVTDLDTYVDIAGNDGGKIPLQIRVSTNESSTSTVADRLSVTSALINGSTFNAINVNRNFPSNLDFTTITLDFRNSITSQPIFLTNVALSAFDIDYANSNGNLFDDFVQITGTTQSGAINGTFQSIASSNVINANGLNNSTATNCPAKNLETRCQGSIKFNQAVNKVIIRYANNPEFITGNPTTQEIDFRLDNYCYVPQYIFSGTVFNDNGGIDDTQADASNANITSGTYFNKPNYFNGVFNPPQESGISGSTVRLTNCANGTTYPTESVLKTGAPTGAYQISIPKTTLGSNTNLCLVESRTGNTYPIRTTSDSRNTGFSATTYNYPNNNFGRVIAANRALVLTKYQYINDCNIAATDYPTYNTTDNPRTGFSKEPIKNVEANECIAYKIVATNRANLIINNFVMTDVLQKKGVGNATATAIKVAPNFNEADYAADSVAIGDNGTVKTNALQLAARDKRDFYFNTQYDPLQ